MLSASATPGVKTATVQVPSNDADESPFEIHLQLTAFDPGADDDHDGVTNEAEIHLAAFGFDPQQDSTALRTLLEQNAPGLGLFRPSDVEALSLGDLVIERDATTGNILLELGIQRSTDVINWTELTDFTLLHDMEAGRIQIEIDPGESDAQLYQVFGSEPP